MHIIQKTAGTSPSFPVSYSKMENRSIHWRNNTRLAKEYSVLSFITEKSFGYEKT